MLFNDINAKKILLRIRAKCEFNEINKPTRSATPSVLLADILGTTVHYMLSYGANPAVPLDSM